MPEGPELYMTAVYINDVCKNKIFHGRIIKSSVNTKNPEVEWDPSYYTISAVSRGKEIKLLLTPCTERCDIYSSDVLTIIFRFGMSGRFKFNKVQDIHKHAHLNFYTKENGNVLSFIDPRRFGSWQVISDWGKDRGPCVIREYTLFRNNVLTNLSNSVFNRPICEALLNQTFFNGIGNYLRAEILYRASVRPFEEARKVLEKLKSKSPAKTPDLLELCHTLPIEVTKLSDGKGYDVESSSDDHSAFSDWLQCYYNPRMRNMVDSNKRTIWFAGDPGPLAPKDSKSRFRKSKTHLDKKKKSEVNEKACGHDKATRSAINKRKLKTNNSDQKCITTKQTKQETQSSSKQVRRVSAEISKPKIVGTRAAKKGKVVLRNTVHTSLDVSKQTDNQNNTQKIKTRKRTARNPLSEGVCKGNRKTSEAQVRAAKLMNTPATVERRRKSLRQRQAQRPI